MPIKDTRKGCDWTQLTLSAALLLLGAIPAGALDYVVVDTGQDACYDDSVEIPCPQPGDPFYGQDSQYDGHQPNYALSGDELTVDDLNTGLTWQKSPDLDRDGDIDANDKLGWIESLAYPAILNAEGFGGYDDWRLPTIKELYSLIDFRGRTGMSAQTSIPYIDTDYFDFAYGDESAGERFIDAQYRTVTEYVGTTMQGDATVFGVNFADGRIKGYPRDVMRQYVRCVRGNPDYGANSFLDNGDGTITDLATGLMWTKADSDNTMNWAQALAHAENLQVGGHTDWRLPNAKELQSVVDYTRAPDALNPVQQGPAIDPIFEVTETESWCWSSTTHLDGPTAGWAAYLCFGQAWGYMGPPGHGQWLNVHGAGSQRSDPKAGDPSQWPYGHGPQGDEVRIYNYVRCVRDASIPSGAGDTGAGLGSVPSLRVAPNPSASSITIEFSVPVDGTGSAASLEIYDTAGRCVKRFDEFAPAETHLARWDGTGADGHALPAGTYFVRLSTGQGQATTKLVITR